MLENGQKKLNRHTGPIKPSNTNQLGTSEADTEKIILGLLNQTPGCSFWSMKNEHVSRYRFNKLNDGMSDLIGSYKGIFTAIEVKIKREYLWYCSFIDRFQSPNYIPQSKKEEHYYKQVLFQQQVKAAGGIAFFTYSLEHTFDMIEKEMEKRK